ncbi:sulfatase-like hydrolase/transferase [Sphingomonas psychrolutea]|nr:sulfatase-like hydrolase/transferase [Sphingomonas psychrolutea]
MKPNMLLVTADQWRGDCLSAAGHPTVRTPNVDALADEGVLFRRHYAGTAPCSPARATLYTGLYQANHRVRQNGSPLDARFDNIALVACRGSYDSTLFGYTDVSLDPRAVDPNDPVLTSYEGVLPGFTVGQILLEHERHWLA